MAGLSMGTAAAGAPDESQILRSPTLLDLDVCVEAAPHGPPRAGVVRSGTFRGARLNGTVVQGGVWIITRPDGIEEVNLQATLRTDDAHTISVRSRGLVDRQEPNTSKSRATPIFETSSARYAWLNRLVTVAVGIVSTGRLRYRVYRIG